MSTIDLLAAAPMHAPPLHTPTQQSEADMSSGDVEMKDGSSADAAAAAAAAAAATSVGVTVAASSCMPFDPVARMSPEPSALAQLRLDSSTPQLPGSGGSSLSDAAQPEESKEPAGSQDAEFEQSGGDDAGESGRAMAPMPVSRSASPMAAPLSAPASGSAGTAASSASSSVVIGGHYPFGDPRDRAYDHDPQTTTQVKWVYRAVNFLTDLFFGVDKDLDHLPSKRRSVQPTIKSGTDSLLAPSVSMLPPSISAGYGELSWQGFDKIVNYMQNVCPDDYRLTPASRFLDIGSGFGKCVLHTKLRAKVARSVGIECIKTRHEKALEALHLLRAGFVPGLSDAKDAPPYDTVRSLDFAGCELFEGDITQPMFHPLVKTATHIYAFDVVFSRDTHAKLLPLVAQCDFTLFGCYLNPARVASFIGPVFTLLHTIKVHTTGKQSFTCFFYVRSQPADPAAQHKQRHTRDPTKDPNTDEFYQHIRDQAPTLPEHVLHANAIAAATAAAAAVSTQAKPASATSTSALAAAAASSSVASSSSSSSSSRSHKKKPPPHAAPSPPSSSSHKRRPASPTPRSHKKGAHPARSTSPPKKQSSKKRHKQEEAAEQEEEEQEEQEQRKRSHKKKSGNSAPSSGGKRKQPPTATAGASGSASAAAVAPSVKPLSASKLRDLLCAAALKPKPSVPRRSNNSTAVKLCPVVVAALPKQLSHYLTDAPKQAVAGAVIQLDPDQQPVVLEEAIKAAAPPPYVPRGAGAAQQHIQTTHAAALTASPAPPADLPLHGTQAQPTQDKSKQQKINHDTSHTT